MNKIREIHPASGLIKPEILLSSNKYFPVSRMKLAIMSVCTLGLYEIYWFYKNWCLVKERDDIVIHPLLRAIFPVIFCYSLFSRIQETGEGQDQVSLATGFLATGWIVTRLLANLPDPYWMLTLLTFVFLLPVQNMVNRINRYCDPTHDQNKHFSGWNIATVLTGGFVVVYLVIELVFLQE